MAVPQYLSSYHLRSTQHLLGHLRLIHFGLSSHLQRTPSYYTADSSHY
ncbi:hypothetical protein BVRB_8g187190 isoform B [Beta vulgaris subsp. vulgaris]|nr:hypothetical protein BVRB_8g187190 isoform B [Beta vulgaris subsp. vulgaris]